MGRSRVAGSREGHIVQFRSDLRRGWHDLQALTSVSHKRLVLAVILVGAALRISLLGRGITYDEAFTCTFYAIKPVRFVLSDYTWPNNHLLHTLLVKCAMAVFGTHLWSVRLPALLAGIGVMPLFYLFVRAMFNRYIAVLALAFVAASGALIEYSAMARGYSLTWFFMIAASLAGRHFAKRNNLVSAALVAVSCALGMWAVPSMIYPALGVYIWLVLYLMALYDTTLSKRMMRLGLSFLLFFILSALAYTPVIMVHSLDHLLHHPTLGESSWARFVQTHQDKAFELWAFFNDTAATWISVLGFAGMTYAVYISTKYRMMVLAILLSSVPVVLLQSSLGPPQTWAFVLFNLHLGSAIAVFYLLKLIQERVYEGFSKRMRTAIASGVILAGMGWLGMHARRGDVERYDDVGRAASWLKGTLKPQDGVEVMDPNDAPLEFHLMAEGLDPGLANGRPQAGGRLYVLVSPAKGQTVGTVLQGRRSYYADSTALVKLKDWQRLEVWAEPAR